MSGLCRAESGAAAACGAGKIAGRTVPSNTWGARRRLADRVEDCGPSSRAPMDDRLILKFVESVALAGHCVGALRTEPRESRCRPQVIFTEIMTARLRRSLSSTVSDSDLSP